MDSEQKDLHTFILNRIYHEDGLLSQRTYNFVTFNAFLATALALSSQKPMFGYTIIFLGLTLAICQVFIGLRTTWAILFWREYSHLVEKNSGVNFDRMLFLFYNAGEVRIPSLGIIRRIKGNQKAMNLIFPWNCNIPFADARITPNTLVGIIIPWLISFFWLCTLLEFLYEDYGGNLIWPNGVVAILFLIVIPLIIIGSLGEVPAVPKGISSPPLNRETRPLISEDIHPESKQNQAVPSYVTPQEGWRVW